MKRWLPWLVAGVAAVALVAVLARSAGAAHPTPRPAITADLVLPPAAVPRTPGAAEAYAAARAVPGVLDGVYCHCECSKHSNHRSLLTCFESEHGAYCDICMGEAVLAAEWTARGETLDAIRRAVDEQFGP